MLFAKKALPSTIKSEDKYETLVHSYTKNTTSNVFISKEYLNKDNKVLIIDDFLANGEAAYGLADLIEQSGAETVGIGICIEKPSNPVEKDWKIAGHDVYSICRIKSLDDGKIEFYE